MVICDVSQKQEENKIHCFLLSFIYPMKRAGQNPALHVVMEFLKRHLHVQKLDKALAQRATAEKQDAKETGSQESSN